VGTHERYPQYKERVSIESHRHRNQLESQKALLGRVFYYTALQMQLFNIKASSLDMAQSMPAPCIQGEADD
jgi:hypothetical protein